MINAKINNQTLNDFIDALPRPDFVATCFCVDLPDKLPEVVVFLSVISHEVGEAILKFAREKELKFNIMPMCESMAVILYEPYVNGIEQHHQDEARYLTIVNNLNSLRNRLN